MATSFGLGDEPVIIGEDIYTQEDVQKAVRGAGYLGIPSYTQEDVQRAVMDAGYLDAPPEFSQQGAIAQLEADLMNDIMIRDQLREEELLGQQNVEVLNKQISDPIVDMYKDNLIEFEGNYGNASFAHKPTSGSGITIAQGLDAAMTSRAKMKSYGVPERVLKQLDQFDAFDKGVNAKIPENVKLERLTKEEFDNVSRNIANKQKDFALDLKTKLPNLSDKAVSILLSLNHWGGSFKSGEESKLTRWSDNLLKGQKSETGVLVSPIQDIVNNPKATDQDLINAIDSIRKSYVPWGAGKDSWRYQTLTNYINSL